MDTSLVIMGIVLMAILILPFLLHHLSQKRKGTQLLNDIISLADSENATISQKEFWRERYAIGIDEFSKKLFYINKNKEKEERVTINLSDVERCRIDALSRNEKTKNGNVTIIERLDLVFTFKYTDRPEKVLQFYNSSEFMSTDNERPLIDKWFGIIKSHIKAGRD